MTEFDFTYLSLGAGVQSTALLIMSALGLHGCPKADVAIFADTGDEPAWVYEQLRTLQAWSPIPIHVVSKGHLSADVEARHNGTKSRVAAIPAWTHGADGRASLLRRHCTREYKIEPIEKKVRQLLGYQKGQRVKKYVRCLLGISLDEAERIRPSRTPWITNAFPLIDARMRRRDCLSLIAERGLPEPKKSSCVFCPYHSDSFWRDLKADHADEWNRAVKFDGTIRDMSMSGVRSPVFLHRSLKPLGEVDFTDRQGDFFAEECSGHCGV